MKATALTVLLACLAAGPAVEAVAAEPAKLPDLTADQIIDRNIAARGGAEAWRRLQTMAWLGHIEGAGVPGPSLPFLLELKRPDKTRFEITALGQQSVRAYDGVIGWKLSPGKSGKPQLQAYTPDELRYARDGRAGQGIDGPLVDYRDRGIAVAVDGQEAVDGRTAYRLTVTLPSGASHHLWIDGQSFLDVQYDRSGGGAPVAVHNRDFRAVDGLQMPMLIESGADGAAAEKMVIERVLVNPPLPDRLFARPLQSAWGHLSAAGASPRRPGIPQGRL